MTIIILNMLLYIIRIIRDKFLYSTIFYNANLYNRVIRKFTVIAYCKWQYYISKCTMIKIINNRNLYVIINLLDFQILLINNRSS